jgi:tetratricopeptide (TPR) repeat protein
MCDFQGRKDPEESAREAICTLAFQIASRLPDYRLKLLYQMQVDKDKINKRSADDLFEFLITEPLNRSGKIPESTRLCLVIDALDEAGRSDGSNALAELLAKHAERLPEWLGVLVTSRPEPYLGQMLKTLSGTAVDGQSAENRQDLADWIDQRLPKELRGEERRQVIEAVIEKSGGTFLYLSLIEADKTLSLADPKGLPDKLDGFFKQTFNRYFPNPEAYGKKTEPFLRLMVAAPGPLPAEMGRQILGWSQRELTLNVIEPMGSLLQERSDGLVFFHASLDDWLSDSRRSGAHRVEDSGAKELGEFVWSNLIKLFGVAPNVTNSIMLKDYAGVEVIEWMPQLVSWIAELTPHVSQWHSSVAISRLPRWLEFHGKYPEAICMARRYLDLKTVEGGDLPDLINAGYLLSDMLTIYEEDFREAEDIARVTYDRARSFFGAESQEAARLAHTIGNILRASGNAEDALPFFREALRTRERLIGWGNGATRLSLAQLSIALADLGRYGELMVLLVSALEASSHHLEDNNPTIRWLRKRIGELQISEANFGKTRI